MAPERHRQAVGLCRTVQLAGSHAGLDTHCTRLAIQSNRLHTRQVDHHAIANRAAEKVVAAGADCNVETYLPCVRDSLRRVLPRGASHDYLRMLVRSRIETEDPAGRIV